MNMIMNLRTFLSVAGFLLLALIFPFQASPAQPVQPKTIKVLAIGNSFSQDAIEQYLYELAAADSLQIVIGNLYYGGCSLRQHCAFLKDDIHAYQYRKITGGIKVDTPNTSLREALADESWDYVSFQQVSQDSGLPESYKPYLDELMAFVRQNVRPDTKFIFHMTWAYASDSNHGGFQNYNKSQAEMYRAIVATAKEIAGNDKFHILIPSGTAIQNARTSKIGDKLCRDGFHLQLTYGRYTAACTWFEALFKKSVIGNKFAPKGVSEYQKSVAQRAAHAAIASPFSITPIK